MEKIKNIIIATLVGVLGGAFLGVAVYLISSFALWEFSSFDWFIFRAGMGIFGSLGLVIGLMKELVTNS